MKNKKLKIGYVTENNPFTDKTAWSGLIYKIREGIEHAGCEVVWINCHPYGKLAKLCKIINQRLHGKSIMFEHTKFFFRLRAMYMDKRLIDDCDLLFFPCGAQTMNFLKTDKPYIYYSDTTFKLMCGYYWDKLSEWQYCTGNGLESGAIKNAAINIRASKWAALSVSDDYGYNKDHTYVLRFGANLDDKDIVPITPYQGQGRLNILFSGVDWSRKGAETAIHAVEHLNKRGIDACLFIVGIKELPKEYQDNPYIEYVGYLNKSIHEQYIKYIDTVSKCHIFLLPTRAECAGIVFGESSAYGMPIYTYDTGGISDYVLNDVNGYLLPLSLGAEDFADKIQSTLDVEKQKQLHAGCMSMYQRRLNWNVWGDEFKEILEKEKLI